MQRDLIFGNSGRGWLQIQLVDSWSTWQIIKLALGGS